MVAKGLGLPDMAIAEFPGVPMTQSKAELRGQVINVLLPRIIDGLSKPLKLAAPAIEAALPKPRDVVFSGTLDQINDYFHDQNWSDGMRWIV